MTPRLLALLVAFVLSGFLGSAYCEEPAKVSAKSAATKPTTKGEKSTAKDRNADRFMRVRRNVKGTPLAMETVVSTYEPANDSKPGVKVDLIGAVHVGEKHYYDELNQLFDGYDVVLYELVAPQGTVVTKQARTKGSSAHPVGLLQDGMKSMLGLEHQLDCIDYTKKNFVHADMSPEEFNKSMTERGESFMQMFLKMMGQGMAQQQNGEGSGDAALLMALFSRDRNLKLKIAMAEQLGNAGGQLDVLSGPEGSTIITQRNKKCFEVLSKELEAGKKKIGVFYGAGHFADMEDRLIKDFGLKRCAEKWLVAWNLEKSAPKAEPKKSDIKKDEAKNEVPKVEEKK
ncbi:MAG: hypothetical protein K8R36_25940 [Planctomycetales bacterium]|nr:hypothetical protein [Planctomycetales bacterium]